MAPKAPVNERTDNGKENTRKPRERDGAGRGHGGRGKHFDPENPEDAPRRKSGEVNPKREYDRKSGTGRGRELSKGGRGAHGFGNVNQDALEAEKDPHALDGDAEAVEKTEGDATADAEASWESAEPTVEAEPEPVTYTMEEFMTKREEARKKTLQILGENKPGRKLDTVDLSTAQKEDLDAYITATKLKKEATKKDQRSTGKSAVVDVAFKFERVQDRTRDERPFSGDRGGRGGRGRGDGRGGRGEGRGKFTSRGKDASPTTPIVFNAMDFPDL